MGLSEVRRRWRCSPGSRAAFAQKKYDNGATDAEIKLGHCGPYSGPASAYGVIGKGIEAYWKSVNDAGGINGRKINFITLDDGYSPAKTVEVVRQLVEQDKVLCLFNTLGTPSNTAIQKYMNQKKVPQLYVATGASKWGKPKEFPWTMGYQPDYHTEAVIYAKHILANVKDAKVGVLMQNDDFGKDYLDGFKEGLGKDADKVIAKLVTYEVTDPTVDSARSSSSRTPAPTSSSTSRRPKFAAQAIRKAADIGWKPAQYMTNVSASVSIGDEAGRLRQRPGHHHGGLPQGSDRQKVGRRRRDEDVARLDGQVHAGRQPGRRQLRLCLLGVVPDAADARRSAATT